ncbi:MAG: T9SS type A sorting domain-containing protein [Flavobacteriales bacterium]|nr:T9SS type A sorting domain-containing protein [Flavobacteriales bacterium]
MNTADRTPIRAPHGIPTWASRLRGALRLFTLSILTAPIGVVAQNVTTNGGSGLAATYPTLNAAITALNAATISSPVVITLLDDETTPQGGFIITASGTAVNTITLRGVGSTPTVTVTAAVPVTGVTHDAIFEIRGGDWIIIENFRMREHAATPVYTPGSNNMTEWGVALTLASPTNGPLNCTVRNNDIALDRLYPTSFGVYANAWHQAETPTTSVALSAPAAMPATFSCSGLVVRGNAIRSVNIGVAVVGARSASSTPPAVNAYNDNITIGGPNPADGNIITDFGSTGAPAGAGVVGIQAGQNAITLRNTRNYVIANNDITSFEEYNGGVLRGIYVDNQTTGSGGGVPAEPAGVTTQVIDNNRISLRQFTSGNAIQSIYVHFNTNNNTVGSSLSVNNNEFHNTDHTNAGPTASGAITFISCNSGSRSHNINNNLFTDLQVKTTGDVTMINSVTIPANATKRVNNNRIVGSFTQTTGGFGTLLLYRAQNGTTPGAFEESIDNDFSNITFSGTGLIAGWDMATNSNNVTRTVTTNTFTNWDVTGNTSLNMIVLSVGGSGVSTVSGNTIRNITRAGTSGALVGLRLGGTGFATATNNTIEGITCGGSTSPNNASGIRINVPANVVGNRIHGLVVTGNFPLVGIDLEGTGVTTPSEPTVTVVRNRISGLHATNSGNAVTVRGIRVESNVGSGTSTSVRNIFIHNNLIGDLRASATGTTTANPSQVTGIDLLGTASFSNRYVSFNTIHLNASSTGTNNFGTSGVFHTTSGTATSNRLVMRNNIIVNTSTAKGTTGRTVAFRRSDATLTNYSNTAGQVSDRNLFHVGNGAMAFIFSNGTTHLATLAAYQALATLAPRDANSVSEMPTFMSVDGTNYGFLHLDPTVFSLAESGGIAITSPASITTDFDGDTRQNPPDIGADEICGPWAGGPYGIATIYVDADGDGYGDPATAVGGTCGVAPPAGHVNNGDDCDDTNALVWQNGLLYVDADGDGYTNGTETVCYGAAAPEGYSVGTLGADCDDSDPLVWQSGLLYVDADGDGYTNGTQTVCYGATVPEGYSASTLGADCDDSDALLWQNGQLYVDADGDGYTNGTQTVCYGATVPEGYSASTLGADCDDSDPLVWQNGLLYVDADGDGYDNGTQTVCYGAAAPEGYSVGTSGTDCDDSDPNLTQEGEACDDGDAGTENDLVTAACTCAGTPVVSCTADLFFVHNTTTNYQDLVWTIHDQNTNAVVVSGGINPGAGSMPLCLPNGCYYLRVSNSGTGTITGGYRLILKNAVGAYNNDRIIDDTDNLVLGPGGDNGISNNEGFCITNGSIGGDEPIYTSCDRNWWKSGDYLVASENATVSAEFGGPYASSSGYEFWFYDPNGGLSFRKTRVHTVSDGFAPNNAVRACHIKLNNWAAANHLQNGTLYNVRIRGVVAGNPIGEYGPACRVVLDPVLAQCHPTGLNDIPGNPNFSCGVDRIWGGPNQLANRIFCRPVAGANLYEWEFTNDPNEQAYSAVLQTTGVQRHLNWTSQPAMQTGRTYNVRVRASKNNGASWCDWGWTCQVTIIPSAAPGNESMALEGDAASDLALWPNPNNGQQVWIALDEVHVNTVAIDIFDLRGQRVMAREIATQGGELYTNIDLGGLAAGTYLVTITAGDQQHVKRLVIQP